MLHEASRHEPLIPAQWNETAARTCIVTIARDAVASYSPQALWPSHPLDLGFHPVDEPSANVRWDLYIGAAGTIWALNHLATSGLPINLPQFTEVVPSLLEPNRARIRAMEPKGHSHGPHGFLTGNTGILLLQARLSGPASVAGQIGAAVDANQDNPAHELMWGSPGTALACLWLYEWAGGEIWADKFRRDVGLLWEQLRLFDAARCYLWAQSLYGRVAIHLGAVHGFAGNAFPVIRGWKLLSPLDQSRWAERLAESLRRTAIWEDDRANWPQFVGKHRPGRSAMLVQHCHGAPGIVNCFAGFPDGAIDDLLIAAGNMTWHAGPLQKGSGLCHGTAGNGYAFLKLFRRTGDQRWLDRARSFAMHAIGQHERDVTKYGQCRYTLWTGDLGLAVYLWNCIAATDLFPTMDNF